MKYTVNLKSWIAGSGWQYSTKIDDLDESMTAAEYVAACNENMDVTPWAYPAEHESFAVEIQDEDGNELSQAWTEEVQ